MLKSGRIWWVYIAECSDGNLYTGATTDVDRRIKQHNFIGGARYVFGRRPVVLRYKAEIGTMSAAMKEEVRIKKLTRAGKLEMIERFDGG
jgi:putative endonuclease